MSLDSLAAFLETLRGDPLLPLYFLGAFVVAGALFLPTWLLILQTGLMIEPPLSFFVAMAGASLSASVFFSVGRLLRGPIRRRFGKSRALLLVDGAGVEHVIALRVLPVLPFTLINVSAGALGMRYRTFIGGTVLGMAPGIFAVTFLGDRARDVFTHPTPASIALLVGAAVLLVAVVGVTRKLVMRRAGRMEAPPP